jgi:hypothetical protein
MNGKENPVELLVICAVLVVLGVLGVVAGLSKGMLDSLDGLLMLSISLMTALIFAILLFVLAKGKGWIGKQGKDVSPTGAPVPGK